MTVHEQAIAPARAIPREAFAFLRGAVQGLPLGQLGRRTYLGDEPYPTTVTLDAAKQIAASMRSR